MSTLGHDAPGAGSRVLVIGGSGLVGSLILPDLARNYRVRVLDPNQPAFEAPLEYVQGSSTDFAALSEAFAGMDAFVYLAMGPKDPAIWEQPALAALQFDMAVKGVYLTLRAAKDAGVTHGVYASSMSVFAAFPSEQGPIPDIPADATQFYGLAKRLGEEVLAAAVAETPGLSMVALRLSIPMADDDWLASEEPIVVNIGTAGSDVAAAFEAALERRSHGFEPIAIAGHGRYVDLGVARELLGWTPQVAHPLAGRLD